MEKTEIYITKAIQLVNPVFIDLTSHTGSPVHIVGQRLLDKLRAEKVGELYSPYFPNYVTSEESGICNLPKLELYASTIVSPNLLILLGEQNIDSNDVYAYYDVAEAAFNFGVLKGCKTFASCNVFRSRKAEDRVYVAATTSQEASTLAEKLGDKPFPFGRIISQTGPLLGLAKIGGFRVISILGSIKGSQDDDSLPDLLLDRLIKVLELTLV